MCRIAGLNGSIIMYTAFFGLNELPFSIAPDPAFLFLSERHREALAHLTFGLGETGGFVLLTGEVGTGKTTVCRCLLAQLPEHTKTAFILNPMLDAKELLATVCDELDVEYDNAAVSVKILFDGIRDALLAHHQQGENTVLIIDEAQHLQPEALEQLRLLTNLETDKRKLLKVILIGQPELQVLLRQQQLRQLAQRITARYHLLPLTLDEVVLYVKHRLQVAGCQRPVFNNAALKRLHQLSGGIPRLINLLCDRAMLAAYASGQWQVDRKLIEAAGREVNGEQQTPSRTHRWWQGGAIVLLLACLAVVGWKSVVPADVPAAPTTVAAKDVTDQVLQQLQPQIRANRALSAGLQDLTQLWGMGDAVGNCQQVQDYGLRCLWLSEPLATVEALRHPALVKMLDAQKNTYFATLVGDDGEHLLLHLNGKRLAVDKRWFAQYWQHQAIVIWQPPNISMVHLMPGRRGPAVQWLANQLSLVDGTPLRKVSVYDQALAEQVRQFQGRYGLTVDGIAGERTLVRLQAALGEVSYPWQQE